MNRNVTWAALAAATVFVNAAPASALFLGAVFGGSKPAIPSPSALTQLAKPSFKFCKTDEFDKVCHTMDRLGGQKCPEPDPLSVKSASNVQRFVKRYEMMLKKAAAAQIIRAKYMPCLSEEARRDHRVDCAVFVKEPNIVTCEQAPQLYRKAWEDGVRGAEKTLVERAIEQSPSRAPRGYEKRRLASTRERALNSARSVIAELHKAMQRPEFAVQGVDLSQVEAKVKADYAAKDAEWAKAAVEADKAQAVAKAAKEKERAERRAAQDAEELEKAKSVKLPKAKMKNAKLARKAGRLVEKRWPGEKALKVILSSKRWEVVRNKWTGIITGRVMDFHLVVQQPSGKCRLFLYGLYQPKELRGFGETSLNGVGASSRVLCERFGATEGQKPAVASRDE